MHERGCTRVCLYAQRACSGAGGACACALDVGNAGGAGGDWSEAGGWRTSVRSPDVARVPHTRRASSMGHHAAWVLITSAVLLLLAAVSHTSGAPALPSNASSGPGRGGVRCPSRPENLRRLARNAFSFGFESYLKHAFPLDELDPIHCCGRGAYQPTAMKPSSSLPCARGAALAASPCRPCALRLAPPPPPSPPPPPPLPRTL
jgi:hypothetical protein